MRPKRSGRVFGIKRGSGDDGPGLRTTVFLKGCPLRCVWCHNPEGISPAPELSFSSGRCLGCGACATVCPSGAIRRGAEGIPETDRVLCQACGRCVSACPAGARTIVGSFWEPSALVSELLRDQAFFEASGGGITFSGGEPLYQHKFLCDCLNECRRHGVHTALDTSGFAPLDVILTAAKLANLVLLDIKDMDFGRHMRNTSVPLEPIIRNLMELDRCGTQLWLRIPVIPNVNDGPDAAAGFARLLGSVDLRHPLYLLPYHRTGDEKRRRLGYPACNVVVDGDFGRRLEVFRGELAARGRRVIIEGGTSA